MDYGWPGSSVHEIFQVRILEWVAVPFSRGSPQPRDQTQVSGIAGRFFTIWATYVLKESEVAQSCPTLCDLMDYSLPGSSVHGIFQARVLEWVAIFFSRGSSRPRGRTRVSHIAGTHFTIWATWEAQVFMCLNTRMFLNGKKMFGVPWTPLVIMVRTNCFPFSVGQLS